MPDAATFAIIAIAAAVVVVIIYTVYRNNHARETPVIENATTE
ncbi:MAG TPA: hypothetical protein VKK79_17105 [Candidatus Lokiarchaeia archaeon]|nr:hypothetical protein [Candidatus Lokiarchaeia archaeon]